MAYGVEVEVDIEAVGVCRETMRAYGVPMRAYGVPMRAYGVPMRAYGVPMRAYGVPRRVYGVPRRASRLRRKPYGSLKKVFSDPMCDRDYWKITGQPLYTLSRF